MSSYLHGFEIVEQGRLAEQASILAPLVYKEVDFSGCRSLLEIGSGVGAQTRILLERYPKLRITCVDSSRSQLDQARLALASFGDRVCFVEQDASALALEERFDAAFLCWILEHVPSPIQLLRKLKEHLHPGAQVVVTEVFNSSFFTSSGFPHLRHYFEVMNSYQNKIGGNPDIGIALGNLLMSSGFLDVSTRFDGFYLDQRSKETRKLVTSYWKELLKSTAPALLKSGNCTPNEVDSMVADLDQMEKDENAIFFYQFVQAKATL